MNTTLNEIRKYYPSKSKWRKLLASLGKTESDNEPLSFREILDHLGIEDALWCLRVLDYKDYCLFNADLAELVLPIFESKFPDDNRPRFAIESIRKYHYGDIDREALKAAAVDASRAANEANAVYANAANAVYADAADAADAAVYAAYATIATVYAADAVYDYANATYAYAIDAANSDPLKIEELFIKHFC